MRIGQSNLIELAGLAGFLSILGLAIEYSPGNAHMKAYERASQIADLNGDGKTTRDEWSLVYTDQNTPETRWAGFDLTTEQLENYSNSRAQTK